MYSDTIDREILGFRQQLECETKKKCHRWPNRVKMVVEYINNHLFDDTLSISGAMQACQIRSNSFRSQFKRYIGKTLHGYVNHQRMEMAKRLLSHEEISIFDVARYIGFEYPESFTRAFSRHTGLSPLEYKAKWLGEKVRRKR